MEFGNYNGYEKWPYQVVGATSALLVIGIVFAGALDSNLFAFLVIDDSGAAENDNESLNVEMKDQQNNDNSSEQPESKTEYTKMDDLESDEPERPEEAAATDGVIA